MDESQSQKGRMEEQFVNFFIMPFCHCFIHPSLSVLLDSSVCVFCGQRERRQHTCPAEKNKADIFVCTLNLHIFLAQFAQIVFLSVLPSRNGKMGEF